MTKRPPRLLQADNAPSFDTTELPRRFREWEAAPIEGHGLYARYQDARYLLEDFWTALATTLRERDALQAENTRRIEEYARLEKRFEVERQLAEEAERERDRLASQVTDLTTALEAYRGARRAMVRAVQSGLVVPQAVTSQILEAEALAGRVLAGVGVGAEFTAGEGLRADVVERSTRAPASRLSPTEEPPT